MKELMNRLWKKEEGFSLIELIIVIAILAIIAAIAVPNLLNNIQKANESADISNAKLIGDAIATAVVQNPDLEGTVIAATTAFKAPATSATTDPDKILKQAVEILNGNVPTLKAKDYSTTKGDNFTVSLDATGKISVNGTKSYTPTGGTATTQLFPQP